MADLMVARLSDLPCFILSFTFLSAVLLHSIYDTVTLHVIVWDRVHCVSWCYSNMYTQPKMFVWSEKLYFTLLNQPIDVMTVEAAG